MADNNVGDNVKENKANEKLIVIRFNPIAVTDSKNNVDSDDACTNEANEKGNVMEDKDYNDNCIEVSHESLQTRNDPLNEECEASNGQNFDMAKDIKKEDPASTMHEASPVRLARIVFDATDLGKDCKTLRLNAATPMRDIKKLFPKHLGAVEDTFMMVFNDREVDIETPHQIFGNNLDGDGNVIKIVKSIKIKFAGDLFHQANLHYSDERPTSQFFVIRQRIAAYLKMNPALIGLVYNDEELYNEQTPESVNMKHGDSVKVIKKDQMKIRLRGPFFESQEKNYMDVDPNVTMRQIKSIISHHGKEDLDKIMLIYKRQELSDQDTPFTLEMCDTDILFAALKSDRFIIMKGPSAEREMFYHIERPLGGLFESCSGTDKESFVFRFNGRIVNDGDTAKSLNMVNGDCIIAGEVLTQVFTGSVLQNRYEIVKIDTQRKFIDVKKYFSHRIGVNVKDIVFKVDGVTVRDDDTMQSPTVISVEILAGLESIRNEGETESIVNERKTESIVNERKTESVVNEGETESIVNERKTESIVNEGKTESIVNEGKTESIVNEGKTEFIVNEGKTESIVNEGETESILQNEKGRKSVQNEEQTELILQNESERESIQNKVQTDSVQNEGETESTQKEEEKECIQNEGDTEFIQKEGEKEAIQNEGDTKFIQNETETEAIQNEGDTKFIQNERKMESVHNEGEPKFTQDEGQTISNQNEGETESTQKEGESDFGLGNSVEKEQGASEMVKDNAEVDKDRKKLKKDKRNKKCARASCKNEGRHRCSRCKAVSYCLSECLSEDWPNHKVHCDYVYEANKDYVCEVNEATNDSNNGDPGEIENTGGEETVD